MTKKNETDEPAYPSFQVRRVDKLERIDVLHPGLTKREVFAAMAMQRLIRPEFRDTNQEQFAHAELVACWATVYADALLKELGK